MRNRDIDLARLMFLRTLQARQKEVEQGHTTFLSVLEARERQLSEYVEQHTQEQWTEETKEKPEHERKTSTKNRVADELKARKPLRGRHLAFVFAGLWLLFFASVYFFFFFNERLVCPALPHGVTDLWTRSPLALHQPFALLQKQKWIFFGAMLSECFVLFSCLFLVYLASEWLLRRLAFVGKSWGDGVTLVALVGAGLLLYSLWTLARLLDVPVTKGAEEALFVWFFVRYVFLFVLSGMMAWVLVLALATVGGWQEQS